MFKKISYFWRDIQVGIKNLILWFTTIWNDRWWDHSFIYTMLHKKLSLMEYSIRKHGHHTNADKDADKIKKCVLLLDRLMKDDYHEIAFKRHYEKWGEPQMNWKDTKEGSDLVQLCIIHEGVKTEEDKKQERKQFKTAAEMENHLRQQDIDMLFDQMKKHIQTWWD